MKEVVEIFEDFYIDFSPKEGGKPVFRIFLENNKLVIEIKRMIPFISFLMKFKEKSLKKSRAYGGLKNLIKDVVKKTGLRCVELRYMGLRIRFS